MTELQVIKQAFVANGLERWAAVLDDQFRAFAHDRRHGDMTRWRSVIEQLPEITPSQVDLNTDTVSVQSEQPAGFDQAQLESLLKQLKPWRKGPFNIHGVFIDTEWRSDWKWQRLAPHIQPLAGKKVLDVGCGNGYHAWRIAGEGASLVVAIDPTQLFWAQFQAIRHFAGQDWPVHFLPLGIEDVPADLAAFDTVFSMGVLYHRRSPMDHLLELKACLRPGGELVIETLVIDGGEGQTLLPAGRYAKMRNVWFIPSASTLKAWLERCGFSQVRISDITATTIQEQRSTDWMDFESLQDFLDPADASKTIEGYPAPKRATLIAQA